ncbi:hypothetical protein [Nonomuraea turcica]|uniref:hypothetical protein n=1 Tax=Nonomuraea sp. G32 TaxID=3067274 RepID=UPI00273CCA72|nr:hypothetical protein [Nonomuraea sp. G32]MDP4501309.1 hypothetical protein [Nonomuraea sp. G32]
MSALIGTSCSAIAADAEVAQDTVYAAAGRKPQIFQLLLETAISGSDQAVPAEERDYVRRIRAATTAARRSTSTPTSSARSASGWPRCAASCARPPASLPSSLRSAT